MSLLYYVVVDVAVLLVGLVEIHMMTMKCLGILMTTLSMVCLIGRHPFLNNTIMTLEIRYDHSTVEVSFLL